MNRKEQVIQEITKLVLFVAIAMLTADALSDTTRAFIFPAYEEFDPGTGAKLAMVANLAIAYIGFVLIFLFQVTQRPEMRTWAASLIVAGLCLFASLPGIHLLSRLIPMQACLQTAMEAHSQKGICPQAHNTARSNPVHALSWNGTLFLVSPELSEKLLRCNSPQ